MFIEHTFPIGKSWQVPKMSLISGFTVLVVTFGPHNVGKTCMHTHKHDSCHINHQIESINCSDVQLALF